MTGTNVLPFDEEKATEAASFFLVRSRRCMSRWRLNKLMYLAEREAWARYSRPMFGGGYFSLDFGPIVSEVLHLTRDEKTSCPGAIWSEHLFNEGTNVRLKKQAPPAQLARGDVEILTSIANQFVLTEKSWAALSSLMHSLPEHRPTTQQRRRWPISLTSLLEKLGKPEDVITSVIKQIKEDEVIDNFHKRIAARPGCDD